MGISPSLGVNPCQHVDDTLAILAVNFGVQAVLRRWRHRLRDAYINLEVLLSPNCADSGTVRPVIYMINLEFDRLVTDIDNFRR